MEELETLILKNATIKGNNFCLFLYFCKLNSKIIIKASFFITVLHTCVFITSLIVLISDAPLSFTFLPAECCFSSLFFFLFSTLIHSTLSVLCLPPLSAHLWSDKSQIIWLTMQNSARCRNPPIPSSAQLANYSEELAHASLLR